MTPKLRALRALALDPRTPLEEARTAALEYVRKGGEASPPPEPEPAPSAALPDGQTLVYTAELNEVIRRAKGWEQRATTAEERLAIYEGRHLADDDDPSDDPDNDYSRAPRRAW